MKIPKRIQPLVEEGLIDSVERQLMSGKEATVFVVRCGQEIRCAKVYKEASQRSFRQAASYQEGRKVKNSRQARAMEKGTRYGRKMQEKVWQNAEVDALYRLAAAGVRVPKPYICFEGVLLMELLTDSNGNAAPRLNDVPLNEAMALDYHAQLLKQVVLMLCAGVIHGDLSEYNILVDAAGPVIIDLPQAIDAAGNTIVFNKSVTLVLARKENLGGTLTAIDNETTVAQHQINIFPNPSNGSFTINHDALKNASWSLYDISGKLIHSERIASGSTSTFINVNIPSGVYSLRIIAEDMQLQKSVIIE